MPDDGRSGRIDRDSREPCEDSGNARLEQLFADFVERLGAGQRFDADEIWFEHPDVAEELVQRLEIWIGSRRQDEQGGDGRLVGTIGDYTLRRELGRGGMGVVYEAWEGSMDRVVALKVLPAGIAADDRAVTRFVREARLAGRLSHPNVVGVYGMGVKAETPFYAMEYIDGETLAQVIAKMRDADADSDAPFGKKDHVDWYVRIARAFADVADGLQHAHAKGVVHRDIKPSNLILDRGRTDSETPRLRILEFGLARIEGDATLTLSGGVVGTPLYMSPEQARRRKIALDHRTDIWSLGATIYESLCGRPPFRGRDHADTLSQIIEREPVELRRVNPRVPRDLETIVLKCLRKDAKDRFGTAEALAQDLRRFVRGDPIESRPQSPWELHVRRLRRSWRQVALAALVLGLSSAAAWFAHSRGIVERRELLLRYDRDVLDAVPKLLAGRFSIELLSGDSQVLSSPQGAVIQPIRPAEIRDFFGEAGESSLEVVLRSLEQLAVAVPDRPEAHYYLARALHLAGRRADAARAARTALRVDPSFVPVRGLLAEGDDGENRLRDAAFDRRSWQSIWLRADDAFRARNWTAARVAYRALADLAEEPFVGARLEARLSLGVAQLKTSAPELAIGSFAVARELTGGLETLLLLAEAYHLSGAEDVARALLDDEWARQLRHERGDGFAALAAVVYDALGDSVQCREWAAKVEEPARRARLEGYAHLRRGEIRDAIASARFAIQHDPKDAVAYLIESIALLRRLSSRARDGPGPAADLARLLDVTAELLELGERRAQVRKIARMVGELAAQRVRTPPRANETRTATMDLDERRRHGELLQRRIQRLAAAAEVAFGLSLGAAASAGDTRVQIGPHAGNFDDVRELAELNDCQSLKWSPSVTEDGLTIVFQAGGSGDIYIAERRGRTDEAGEPTAFDPPQPLDELNRASSDNNPNISPDGLEIVFASRRDGSSDLYVARRADRSARFGEPESLGAPINTPELVESDGQFSRDGRSLYFMRGEQGPRWGVDTAIFVAMRPDAGVDWDDDSVPVSRVEGTDIVSGEGSPSLSSDGETLFWSEWFPLDPQDPPGDIWFARRVDGALDTFADARMLPYPVNTVGAEITPWIGYDWPAPGSKLWFVRELPGCGFSIFEATWYPADDGIGPFRRGDCNDDGAVDISDGICALEWLFLAGAAPDCLAVLNADGDDGLNITDPTYLFNHLFLGSPSLPAPFPDCGGSESEADARLGCEQSACP